MVFATENPFQAKDLGLYELSRPLRLAAMLWVNHFTKLKQPCGTHARIMDERNADHSNGWIHVTCLLAE